MLAPASLWDSRPFRLIVAVGAVLIVAIVFAAGMMAAKLMSGHNLSHYPMSVVVTKKVDDVLAGDTVLYIAGAAGIIALMIAAAAFLLTRRIAGRLKAQNRQLDAALNNMSQGLTMFDASGHLIVCNERYLEMFNLPPEAAKPGCTLGDLLRHRSRRGNYDRYDLASPTNAPPR